MVLTSIHPHTDGAYKIMNRIIENYLRYYVSYHYDDMNDLLSPAEFAYNSSVSVDLECAPFRFRLAWKPTTVLNFISKSGVNVQMLEELNGKLKILLEAAKFFYKLVKSRKSSELSLNYMVPKYQVVSKNGINKTLFTDLYSKSQESPKLLSKRADPFTIRNLLAETQLNWILQITLKYVQLFF